MTQIFDAEGKLTPVTAVSVGPCTVLGLTSKNLRIGYEEVDKKKVNKPQIGMFEKLNIAPHRVIREVRMSITEQEVKVGDKITADIFKEGDYVDVVGTSIGKGFQGGMKRWNWSGQPASHGSMMHRRPGSSGSNTTPGRVFKGHHMPGHMGNARVTVQNVKVIKVDLQNNLLVLKGCVPGHRKNLVLIQKAKKKVSKVK